MAQKNKPLKPKRTNLKYFLRTPHKWLHCWNYNQIPF